MRIDAHQHFWSLDRGDYDWLTAELAPLYRDFEPSDLTPLLRASELDGSVLVQAASTVAETRFMLDIAKREDFVLGVVGWVDMDQPDAIEQLDSLISYGEGYLKGVRPMIQDIEDVDWILSDGLDDFFEAMTKRDLVFDALVRPVHLSNLETRLRRHPRLRTVIDHGGKPAIAYNARISWSAAMASLAENTSALCKLSGLVTEATENWNESDIMPYMQDLLRHFGAKRLVWGSDWPVLNLASDYSSWLKLARTGVADCSDSERADIFGGNAQRLYGLEG